MPKYRVEYILCGSVEVEAECSDSAVELIRYGLVPKEKLIEGITKDVDGEIDIDAIDTTNVHRITELGEKFK